MPVSFPLKAKGSFMLFIALIILGIALVIQGKVPVFGGQIVEGKRVRILGAGTLILSLLAFFNLGNLHWWFFGFEILILILFYFFVKGRESTTEEKKDLMFSSKSEEADVFKGLVKGILIFIAVLGVVFGGLFLILMVVTKSS